MCIPLALLSICSSLSRPLSIVLHPFRLHSLLIGRHTHIYMNINIFRLGGVLSEAKQEPHIYIYTYIGSGGLVLYRDTIHWSSVYIYFYIFLRSICSECWPPTCMNTCYMVDRHLSIQPLALILNLLLWCMFICVCVCSPFQAQARLHAPRPDAGHSNYNVQWLVAWAGCRPPCWWKCFSSWHVSWQVILLPRIKPLKSRWGS